MDDVTRDIARKSITRMDGKLAELAGRQYGVVARRQLLPLGIGEDAIEFRIRSGRMHVVHAGVYAVGHAHLGARARWLAATLACGPAALLSHLSAAALRRLLVPVAGPTDVTTPVSAVRKRKGIRTHRARNLGPEDRAVVQGIPLTSIARTLLDLAATMGEQRLRRVAAEAERQGLVDLEAVQSVCRRNRGHRGRRRLLNLVAGGAPAATRSELEDAFLTLCREHRLPRPQVNQRAAGLEVDAQWPHHRLVVELDGFAFHRDRGAFERDRVRDARLTLAGYRVLRVISRRLAREPKAIAAEIRLLLRTSSLKSEG